MSTVDKIKNARDKGFGPGRKAAGKQQEGNTPAAPAVGAAQESAIQFIGSAQNNIQRQLQDKADFLQSLDHMLDQASVAIANAEQDILSGVSLERKLASRRSEYMEGVKLEAAVSLEFEALNTIEALAKPVTFPSVADSLKRIQPADRKRLDAVVLSSEKQQEV